MATTKTLTPTNQAITLAAFTEKPDNRTNVTNDDRLADAVNALNSMGVNNTKINLQVNGLTPYSHAGETVYHYVEGKLVSLTIPSDCKTGTPTIGLAT